MTNILQEFNTLERAAHAQFHARMHHISSVQMTAPRTQQQIEARVVYKELDGAVTGGFAGGFIGMGIALTQLASGMYSYSPPITYFDSGILHNILLMTVIGAIVGTVLGGLESAISGFEDAKHRYVSFRKTN